MDAAPEILPITEVRDDIAGIIRRAGENGAPVFITQKGRLTAVLLSRRQYDELLGLLAARAGQAAQAREPGGAAPRSRCVAGFPETRRRTRVDTLYGPADPETAAFFAEMGVWTEDQGGPPPPWPWLRASTATDEADADEGESTASGSR